MRDHDFRLESLPSELGKPGEWHRCGGCGKRVFFPAGFSVFQRRLVVATAWMGDLWGVPEEILDQRRAADGTGFHGILSMDCDRARGLPAELADAQDDLLVSQIIES